MINVFCLIVFVHIFIEKTCEKVLFHKLFHLRKPRIPTPLRSLCVRNEEELVPLACEDEVFYDNGVRYIPKPL